MAYSTINKHTDYFNTKLYTGNGGTQSLTGVGFQPDFTWIKSRSLNEHHNLYDAVRGVTKPLYTNLNYGEGSVSDSLTAFGTDGFSIGANAYINSNSATFASWNWKANGAGSANTDGTINSTVSVNTTAGFSIVKYTGTGSAGSVGHGLSVKPDLIISKAYSASGDWNVYHDSFSAQQRIKLNSASNTSSNSSIFASLPTNQVVNIGTGGDINTSGTSHLFYCFASKTGYSKFGSYAPSPSGGNPFIYTGFKPSFLIIKGTVDSRNWILFDNKREDNEINNAIKPNANNAEFTESGLGVDILSNGFKIRGASGQINTTDGVKYLYIAFGQTIVGSNNVPATAR